MKLAAILAGVAALSSLAAMTPSMIHGYTNPIGIKGYKMFDFKTGAYFAAKGIDYYPHPNAGTLDGNNIDFFTDEYSAVWSQDVEYLAAAGANAVRLYAMDPSKSHDKFMCALRSHGMYALVDLGASCTNCSISNDPYPACYSKGLKDRGEQIILAFSKYDNVLSHACPSKIFLLWAFSAGNEVNHVVTDPKTNAPCQKKFIKDMRTFITGCSTKMRAIPVGVVSADHSRSANALYYNCRTSETDTYENAEWCGLNAYQYCDNTQTEVSQATGFSTMVTDFVSYKTSIPVMLAEFGCLNKGFPTAGDYAAQRTWLQAGWLFTKTFRQVFSGGFAFEFSTENANSKEGDDASVYPFTSFCGQNYGLGYYSPGDCDHSSIACVYTPMDNYNSLALQYNATNYSGELAMSAFTPESGRASTPTCPAGFASLKGITWDADSVSSRACPSAVLSFTCSGQTSSGTWAGSAFVTSTGATTGSTAGTGTGTTNTATPGTTTSGSASLPAGLATSVISSCMALAIGVAFA